MSRYEISATGDEVTDTKTGLVWARCSVGQEWDGETCVGEVKEMQYDEAMEYAASQDGWRLPTIDELRSLIDRNYRPMIDNVAFPNTEACVYWSSSPYEEHSLEAWGVSFYNGGVGGGCYRYGYSLVRLVKGE